VANTAILVSTCDAYFTKSKQGRAKSGQSRKEAKTQKGKSHKNKGRAERLSHFLCPWKFIPRSTAKCAILTTFKGVLSSVWQT
jgi:hypothetical protein